MDDSSSDLRRSFQKQLAQARAGSRAAFYELIFPFRIALRRMARKRHERRLQAKFSHSDLLQITSLQAFENLHQFHGNTFEEFGCWLLGIMDHTVAGQNRKYHRPGRDIAKEIPLETVWDRLTARQAVSENDETSQRLKAALDKLPETYRKLLVWHYYEKKSHQEIGNLIGASADAAKHTCHRAVGRLAVELHKEMEG